MCQQLRCLPQAGGLFDQDHVLALKMRAVLIARVEKEELEAKKRSSQVKGKN